MAASMGADMAQVPGGAQLSFDEFQAVSARARSLRKTQDGDGPDEEEDEKETKETAPAGRGLGEFLEMTQVQSFVILMIFLDVFAAFMLALIQLENSVPTATTSNASASVATAKNVLPDDVADPISIVKFISKYVVSTALLQNALTSFTGFTVLFFALEILAILVVFNLAVVGHFGYTLDSIVVAVQLYTELSGTGIQSRLLSVLRSWRLVRLMNALVTIEREAHDQTKVLMSEKDGLTRQLQGEIRRSEEELARELEARKAVDEMLASYKEEVETLNEALKIAAMDIAEVAEADDDLLLSDDEEELLGEQKNGGVGGADDDDDDQNDFVDASGSAHDKARNREALMREARRDAYNPQAAAMRKAKDGNATFRVHEDGTFDVTR